MTKHLTRRWILGALVMAVAATTALGAGHDASADTKEDGHGSKDNFKSYCKTLGGTFSEDGLGNTKCTYSGGSYTECDANGNDCWYIPEPRQAEPEDPFDPYDGGEGQVSDDPAGADAPAPVTEAPLVVDDSRTVSPVDAPVAAPAALAEEPLAAVEPVAAEGSVEQP
jgi:hypothetical protein